MSLVVLLAMTLLGPRRRTPDEDRRRRRLQAASATSPRSSDVTLEVPEGSLTALLGPSGSGKSTLLRIIAGLEQPDTRLGPDRRRATSPRARPQERGIGFVFQHYAPFAHMSVRENVAFGLRIRKRPKRGDPRAGRRAARRWSG